jgi:integrase
MVGHEGDWVDPGRLDRSEVTVEAREPIMYHLMQLREILRACDPASPQQELAVRILVGSGVRISELCGLAVEGRDGLPDLIEAMGHGRVALRVRGEGGRSAGARRIPITLGLAAAVEHYWVEQRPAVDWPQLLISGRGRPYDPAGVDSMLGRLQTKVGFRVHAQAFRRTFAAVACQVGWELERLRAAMGHASSRTLWRYVRLACERDLGRRSGWAEFVLVPERPAR